VGDVHSLRGVRAVLHGRELLGVQVGDHQLVAAAADGHDRVLYGGGEKEGEGEDEGEQTQHASALVAERKQQSSGKKQKAHPPRTQLTSRRAIGRTPYPS